MNNVTKIETNNNKYTVTNTLNMFQVNQQQQTWEKKGSTSVRTEKSP